ncbi:hypothetical protein JCM14244_09160 [Venenivibrio stagnispumantis]|uniref:Uncharacterized protein n=1 Tax=Venenivibrio stagnispumantis TaxID=407998 RepID=A0AA45WPC0_9AQUI|nr:hypothetical protein [Venenivibrio stagnispumantis]MCW4573387.1 hypothetical protein [Venenivibrio stagnispumantis]SMP20718.1 hypothetical protein SAMN06264868_12111 [Venenivibrio stagnispumantis]
MNIAVLISVLVVIAVLIISLLFHIAIVVLLIWAINTIFNANIEYNFTNIVAGIVIIFILRWILKRK